MSSVKCLGVSASVQIVTGWHLPLSCGLIQCPGLLNRFSPGEDGQTLPVLPVWHPPCCFWSFFADPRNARSFHSFSTCRKGLLSGFVA